MDVKADRRHGLEIQGPDRRREERALSPGRSGSRSTRAVEVGKIANMPVMVDFGSNRPERPLDDLLNKMFRPGDIYTHIVWRRARRTGREDARSQRRR